ncbi:hypothetical protein K2173_007972 [Erythroxylum novogranatense]|uniref:Uncharacterized protein n=1 Tax=Erythroxylum novogranatense TaxID=1862640 RepID=A0AAV8T8M7_9ROSI|nr:hypothetical protein K2173_007972 [Erythroxylum novogranatense]
MDIFSCSVLPSTPNFTVKSIKNRPFPVNRCLPERGNRRICLPECYIKVANAEFGEPSKVKLQLSIAKERLLEAVPEPVQDFPWRKAEDVLLKRLAAVGWEVFKWSSIAYITLSSLSDVILTISRSQELVVPFGLLLGCLMTDFFKEILQEMLHAEEGQGLKMLLVAISCFFVLVKALSSCFTVKTQLFLLHAANGGLMQALWLSRGLSKSNHKGNEAIAGKGEIFT